MSYHWRKSRRRFQTEQLEVQELNFRSSQNVWGYFSVTALVGCMNLRIHNMEIVSHGERREEAKQLVLSIEGAIHSLRLPNDSGIVVEEPSSINNNFDTMWLDNLIVSNIKILCGRDIPQWVNRLAYISGCIPFLQRALPKEWLTPVSLQQSIDAQQHRAETTSSALSSPDYSSLGAAAGGNGGSSGAGPTSSSLSPNQIEAWLQRTTIDSASDNKCDSNGCSESLSANKYQLLNSFGGSAATSSASATNSTPAAASNNKGLLNWPKGQDPTDSQRSTVASSVTTSKKSSGAMPKHYDQDDQTGSGSTR